MGGFLLYYYDRGEERKYKEGTGDGDGGWWDLAKSSQKIQVMSAIVPFSWCEIIMCAYHILSRWGEVVQKRGQFHLIPF